MRLYRISFVCGLAAGYLLGARAGRERYEQIAKNARTVAEHPAVRQAAQGVQSTVTRAAKSASQMAACRGQEGASRLGRRRRATRAASPAGSPSPAGPVGSARSAGPAGAAPGEPGRPATGPKAATTASHGKRHHGKPAPATDHNPPFGPASGDFGDFELP